MSKKVTLSTLAGRTEKSAVRRYTRELIRQIDEAIVLAYAQLLPHLKYPLPVVFDFPGIPRKDMQIYLYSELLEVYNTSEKDGGRGFSARIEADGDSVFIIVSWPPLSIITNEDRDRRAGVLAKYGRVSLKKSITG